MCVCVRVWESWNDALRSQPDVNSLTVCHTGLALFNHHLQFLWPREQYQCCAESQLHDRSHSSSQTGRTS